MDLFTLTSKSYEILLGQGHLKVKPFLYQIVIHTYCMYSKNENDIFNSSLIIKDQSL